MNNINKFLGNTKFKEVFSKARQLQKRTNFAIEIYSEEDATLVNPEGPLANVPFFIKDNYDYKNHKTTAGSQTLLNHTSLITATVVQKLLNAGAIPVGKANLDEFAMGGSGLTSGMGPVVRDDKPELIIGGSSSGSAIAVQSGVVPFALGSDTGDSVRQPASWGKNLVGFKPTWGLISRYGIHAFSPSFDTVAFFTQNVKDQVTLLNVCAGYDEKDFTSANMEKKDYVESLNPILKDKKVAIIKEAGKIFDKEYLDKFNSLVDKLKKAGVEVNQVSIDINLLKTIYPAYQSIAFAEAQSQLASINGLSFSEIQIEEDMITDMKKERENKFSKLVKERITIGSATTLEENMDKVFIKAKKIRQVIINWASEVFKNHDVVITPASTIAPKVADTSTSTKTGLSLVGNFFQIWNMNGSPAITIPFDKINENDISIEIAANIFQDQKVLDTALAIENILKGEQ